MSEALPKILPLSAALIERKVRCGKPGCRCASGELHGPYMYVAVRTGSRRRLLYVPTEAVQAVTRRVQTTGRLDAALAQISAINLELLARGELG